MRVLFFFAGLAVFGCSGDAFVSADASATDSAGQDVTVPDAGFEGGSVEGGGSHFCNGQQPTNLVFCEDWDSSPSLPSAWTPQNVDSEPPTRERLGVEVLFPVRRPVLLLGDLLGRRLLGRSLLGRSGLLGRSLLGGCH